MSDVIWAALIAVLGSGIGATIAAVATAKVAKRSSETAIANTERQAATAIATAERNAEVEMAKVQGELDKAHADYRERERSNRQGTYHRALAVLDRLDLLATGYNPEGEEPFLLALEELNNMIGGIHLFGAAEVREALGPLSNELNRLGASIAAIQHEDPTTPYAVAYGASYRGRRTEITEATAALTEAMRADITAGIHSP